MTVHMDVVETGPDDWRRPRGRHEFLVVPVAGDLVRLPPESPADDGAVFKVLHIEHWTVPVEWKGGPGFRNAEPTATVYVRFCGTERVPRYLPSKS